jgi:predicted nucleic acid-binding protein
MGQYLIDTNAVCDYLTASFSEKGMRFMDGIVDNIPHLSVITQIELLCWKTNPENLQKVQDFIAASVILGISPEVINHCVTIRKSKKIKTPDAIIAATALALGFFLISNNTKDFENIRKLKTINPMKG